MKIIQNYNSMKTYLKIKKNPINIFSIIFITALISLLSLLYSGCKKVTTTSEKSIEFLQVNPAFREYIEGFTSGFVSSNSPIAVRFRFDCVDSTQLFKPLKSSIIRIKPKITGNTQWIDTKTLVFTPEESFKQNTHYIVSMDISEIIPVPDSLKILEFSFHTIKQDASITINKISYPDENNLGILNLSGTITLLDKIDTKDLLKHLNAHYSSNSLQIKLIAEQNQNKFHFSIDSIARAEKAKNLQITLDGTQIGMDRDLLINYKIPELGKFELLGVTCQIWPEFVITLTFSEPLDENQDLSGKIEFLGPNYFTFHYQIDNCQVHIYPSSFPDSERLAVSVSETIVNCKGGKLYQSYEKHIDFIDMPPQIDLLANGTIMPSQAKAIIPFRIINLKAVDIRIFKIFENNVHQFLQTNDLEDAYQLSRVGKVIVHKTIPINSDGQLRNKWQTYNLDLSKLFDAEPGAIYRLEISAKKEYSMIPCNKVDNLSPEIVFYSNEAKQPEEWNFYLFNYDYDEFYDYEYYWHEFEYDEEEFYESESTTRISLPFCNDYYFNALQKTINVLSSDIGLICKTNGNNGLFVIATDINTAKPMSGVAVKVYNYQNQLLAVDKTDQNGICSFNYITEQPYLIVAQKDKSQSYLLTNSNNALSLSHFDVSGEQTKDGIKGFIYTERGIWRPGDSIFAGFILQHPNLNNNIESPVIFELYNPRGMLVDKKFLKDNINGLYVFRTCTRSDALTGNYNLYVRIGASVFHKTIKIETIKPNRLYIKVKAQSTPISFWQKQSIKVISSWLHGAPASNLRIQCDAKLKRQKTIFEKFKNYLFDDLILNFSPQEVQLYDGILDDEGQTSFTPKINLPFTPGMLNAQIETRVYEPGGEFSIDISNFTFSPYRSYVGLKVIDETNESIFLPVGKTHTFAVANVNENGQPIKNNSINLKIYKAKYTWWWETFNDFEEFLSSTESQLIMTDTLHIKDGQANFNFQVSPEDEGEYVFELKDNTSGHCCRTKIQFNRYASEQKIGAELLSIQLDKEKYKVGDEATVTCMAPEDAYAYLTIEKNNRILSSIILKEKNGKISYTFKITEDFTPNVYVWLTILQPYEKTSSGLPIRMYGVVPIFVENEKSRLSPQILTTTYWKPKNIETLKISELNGQPMTYTIAIVDEGLLQLTHFKTPDPHSYFFSREALKVTTFDYFDKIFNSWSTSISRSFTIGGAEEAILSYGSLKAQRFKPFVRFYGPFQLKKSSTNTHNVTIPDYVGAVRIMVIAKQDEAYGSAEKTVEVISPLMVIGSVPRMVGPNESFNLPITIFANDKSIKNTIINIKANNLLKIVSKEKFTVDLSDKDEYTFFVPIQVKEKIGIATVEVSAKSGKLISNWNVEFNVRLPNPPISDVNVYTVEPGQYLEKIIEPIGLVGTNENTIEIFPFLPINVDKWLNTLIDYPHICTEQLISGVFPLLYSEQLAKTNQKIRKLEKDKIIKAIKILSQRQLSDGSVVLWPNDRYGDQWTTSYAGHFAIEARKAGYAISDQFFKLLINYQQKTARSWKRNKNIYNNDLMQAYRLYTLALCNAEDLSLMNKLSEEKFLSNQGRWVLASAYAVIGRTDMAKKLISQTKFNIPNYVECHNTYGSQARDLALGLEAYVHLNLKNDAFTILQDLMKALQQEWLNTQTIGQCLRSIAIYLKKYPSNNKINFQLSVNNNMQNFSDIRTIQTIQLSSNQQSTIKLKNTGQSTIYVTVTRRGIPLEVKQIPKSSQLKMTIEYFDLNDSPIDISRLAQGKTFYAKVYITHPGILDNYKNIALTNVFASGWEILSDRIFDNTSNKSSAFTYQDIRDDRVLTYFDLEKHDKKVFWIKLSATYAGRFYLPIAYCEAMYDGRIRAYLPGQWVEVINYNQLKTINDTSKVGI